MEWLKKLFKQAKQETSKQEPVGEKPLHEKQTQIIKESVIKKPPDEKPEEKPETSEKEISFKNQKEEAPPDAFESLPEIEAIEEIQEIPDIETQKTTPGESIGETKEVIENEIIDTPKDGDEKTQNILLKFLETEGITGVVISSLDGFLIGSAGQTGTDTEAIGVLASSEVSVAHTLAQEAGSGALNQIILEFTGSRVILDSLGEDLILVVVGTEASNLGMLRLAINNLKKEIIHSLS